MRRSSSAASPGSTLRSVGVDATAQSEPEVEDEVSLDRETDKKPLFQLNHAPSATYLKALRPDGAPPRRFWDANAALSSSTPNLFRLKAVKLPELHDHSPNRQTQYSRNQLYEDACAQLKVGSPTAHEPAPVPEKPKKRADRYFNILMQAHGERTQRWADADEDEAREKAEGAALAATRRAVAKEKAEQQRRQQQQKRGKGGRGGGFASESRSSSDDDDDDDDDDDRKSKKKAKAAKLLEAQEDLGPLVAFDGNMEVEVEVVLLRAPDRDPSDASSSSGFSNFDGASEASSSSTSGSRSASRLASRRTGTGSKGGDGGLDGQGSDGRRSSSKKSSGSSSKIDLYEELEALKEEVGVDEEDAGSEDSDDLPEGLKMKRINNIWDNPKPRWALGLGGTVFFVPDAERYAFGASMPPPPPPSLQGRRRMRLKPRLPLEISNHRYRDEHPNIWPEAPYSPELDDYTRFEQKMMTLDFYRGCSSAMTQLPRAERPEDLKRHKRDFGRTVLEETKRSAAWKNWNHREKLRRKEEERRAREEAEAAALAEREARLAAQVAAAGLA